MEDKSKDKKPNSIEPRIVFYSLRALFSLINKKNAHLNPKDYPGGGSVE